jgi:hypothetical protein
LPKNGTIGSIAYGIRFSCKQTSTLRTYGEIGPPIDLHASRCVIHAPASHRASPHRNRRDPAAAR